MRGSMSDLVETEDSYRLTGIVVRQSAASAATDLVLHAWIKNRATQLACFLFDTRGRLIGQSHLNVAKPTGRLRSVVVVFQERHASS